MSNILHLFMVVPDDKLEMAHCRFRTAEKEYRVYLIFYAHNGCTNKQLKALVAGQLKKEFFAAFLTMDLKK